jgi:hypothetical protein
MGESLSKTVFRVVAKAVLIHILPIKGLNSCWSY